MTDLREVVELHVRDNLSAGMGAAQESIDKFNAALDRQDATIRRTTPTAETLVRRLDAVTKAEAALAAVTSKVARERETLDAGLRNGTVAADAHARAIAAQNAALAQAETNLARARGTASATANAVGGLATNTKEAAWQMRQLAMQTPDVVQGLLGGQSAFQVLLQQGGQVVQVMGGVGAALRGVGSLLVNAIASPGGAAVIATAALAGLGYAAESAERRMINLQNSLRATRSDYVSLAETVNQTAKNLAANSNIGTGEARDAGRIIAASPAFSGDSGELANTIRLAKDLSEAMGIELPEAAQRLASAMRDPGAAAQRLADDGLRSMSQALAYSIKLQAEAGDRAGAYARVVDSMREAVGGAAGPHTALQKAMAGLSEAFTKTGQDGRSLAESIGSVVTGAATVAIDAIAGLVRGIENLRQAARAAVTGTGADALRATPTELQGMIQAAAQGAGLDPQLVALVHSLEGVRNPDGSWQVSRAGARGPMQMMPGTFAEVAGRYGIQGGIDDEAANFKAGALYLRELISEFRDLGLAVAAYNAGPGRVRAFMAGGDLPDETRAYIQNVRSAYSGRAVVAPMPGQFVGPPSPTVAQMGDMRADQAVADRAFAIYRSGDALSTRRAMNTAQQTALQQGIDLATRQGDTERVGQLTEALQKLRGAATELVSEQEKIARSAEDSAAALTVEDGATRELAAIRQRFVETARRSGTAVDEAAVARAQAVRLQELSVALYDNVDAMNRKADAEARVLPLLERGGRAAEYAANRERAVEEVRKSTLPNTIARKVAEEALTAAYNRSTDAAIDRQAAMDVAKFQQQIEYQQTEYDLLTATTEERVRELAILQERQKLGLKVGEQATEQQQRALDAAGAAATLGEKLRKAQSIVNGVADSIVQAFDDVGKAIVNAYVLGERGALNWQRIGLATAASVGNALLKSLVIQPATDALRPAIAGALGFGGGGGAGSGSIMDFLGLTSLLPKEGILSSLGLGELFGAGQTLTQSLSTGAATISGGSLGSLLGAAGLGFGAGSLLNSMLGRQGAQATNGMIGSGAGALAGMGAGLALDLAFPGVGTLVSILGGLAGGGIGGLFGPGESVKGYGYRLEAADDGLLKMGASFYNETGAAAFQEAAQGIAALNDWMGRFGITVGGASIVGGNKNGPDYSNATAGSFAEGVSQLYYHSTDADLERALSARGNRFASVEELQKLVEGLKATKQTIEALTAEPVPAFTAQMKAITDTFDAALTKAREYGLAEDALTAARAKAVSELENQRAETLRQSDASLAVRRLAAAGNTQEAELARQAEAARQELKAFADQLDTLAITAAEKAARLVELEQVQAAERAEIIRRYGEEAADALRDAGGNIRSYLDSLATSAEGGASPTDRLAAAQAQFARDRTLAMGGDRDALARITSTADALLSAGRDMYASSEGFQTIRQDVIDSLGNLPVVKSYDAIQAEALQAIQDAIENGTLNTAILGGNTVTIAGGTFSVGGVETRLDTVNTTLENVVDTLVVGLGGVQTNTANTVDTLVAGLGGITTNTANTVDTLVVGLGDVVTGLGNVVNATGDGLDVVQKGLVDGFAAQVIALNSVNTNLVNAAGVSALAVSNNSDWLAAVSKDLQANTSAIGNNSDWLSGLSTDVQANTTALGVSNLAVGNNSNWLEKADQSIKDLTAALSEPPANDNLVVNAIKALKTDVLDALAIGNRYAAATAWNTKLLAGEGGITISAAPETVTDKASSIGDPGFAGMNALAGVVEQSRVAVDANVAEVTDLATLTAQVMQWAGRQAEADATTNRLLADLLRGIEALAARLDTIERVVRQTASEESQTTRDGLEAVRRAVDEMRAPLTRLTARL